MRTHTRIHAGASHGGSLRQRGLRRRGCVGRRGGVGGEQPEECGEEEEAVDRAKDADHEEDIEEDNDNDTKGNLVEEHLESGITNKTNEEYNDITMDDINDSNSKYNDLLMLTVSDLKKIAREKHISTGGIKAELINRILAVPSQ